MILARSSSLKARGRDIIRFIAIKLHTKDELDFRAVLYDVVDLTFVIPIQKNKVSIFL